MFQHSQHLLASIKMMVVYLKFEQQFWASQVLELLFSLLFTQ